MKTNTQIYTRNGTNNVSLEFRRKQFQKTRTTLKNKNQTSTYIMTSYVLGTISPSHSPLALNNTYHGLFFYATAVCVGPLIPNKKIRVMVAHWRSPQILLYDVPNHGVTFYFFFQS